KKARDANFLDFLVVETSRIQIQNGTNLLPAGSGRLTPATWNESAAQHNRADGAPTERGEAGKSASVNPKTRRPQSGFLKIVPLFQRPVRGVRMQVVRRPGRWSPTHALCLGYSIPCSLERGESEHDSQLVASRGEATFPTCAAWP